MSVIIDITYEDETFEVEIFRDGSIEFPGRDFQYEQAAAEFMPPGSAAVMLHRNWTEYDGFPMDIILRNIDTNKEYILSFATDCVEHVVNMYEFAHDGDKMVRTVIEAARRHIAGDRNIRPVIAARNKAGKFVTEAQINDSRKHNSADEAAAAAAEWLGWAISETHLTNDKNYNEMLSRVRHCVQRARDSAAIWDLRDEDYDSDEYKLSYKNEAMWQIRRFVDVMEAVESGKDWPPMRAIP